MPKRVHELARQLGINKHELVEMINELDLNVSADNAFSVLTDEESVDVQRALRPDLFAAEAAEAVTDTVREDEQVPKRERMGNRKHQYTKTYRRGDEVREVEVNNLLVFLRGVGEDEQMESFLQVDERNAFLSQLYEQLSNDGFILDSTAEPPEYDYAQARTDFKAVARDIGLTKEEIDDVLEEVATLGHPLRYLRSLLRAVPGLRWDLLERSGDLYTICFGEDDDALDRYSFDDLDSHARLLLEGGTVFGAAGLDAWVIERGNVWREHPEDCAMLGPATEFMAEQVRDAKKSR